MPKKTRLGLKPNRIVKARKRRAGKNSNLLKSKKPCKLEFNKPKLTRLKAHIE